MVLVSGRIDLSKTMPESSHPSPDLDAMLAHSGWVRALARSLVADPDLADDIEQQTWLTAMRRPPSHDRNLRSWLGSVVRSMAGMHWRESEARQRRERVVADRQQEQGLRSADAARPESLSERMETFRELAAAVAGLQEPYGTSVYLRYFEELSVREVARRTKVPVPTAQSRISRGVQMLRTRMENRLGDIWRQRCLVFTLPLAKAPWWGVAAIVTMTLKTKLMLGAAVLALLSLFVIQPWETQPAALEQDSTLAAAELDAQTKPVAEPLQPVAEVERTELAPEDVALGAAPAMDNEKLLSFRVLDAVTLEPVPDAEVWYFDHATDPDEEWRYASRSEYLDSEQLVKKFGNPGVLAANGQLRVPFPEGYAMAIARRGGTFAYKFHHPDFYNEGDEHEMLLKPVRTQEVRVVDQAGKPLAGIEVHFCPEPASDAAHAREKIVTDAMGRATFRHLELVLREDSPGWKNTIAVPIPGVSPAFVEMTPSEVGEGPIEFVVPPTGAVHVTCVNSDGSFLPDGTPVFLMHKDGSGGPMPNAYLRSNAKIAYTRNGKVRMPRVGIGLPVQVIAQVRGMNAVQGIAFDGPKEEGEIVQAELRLGPAPKTLTMQVVDSQGQAPASGFYSLFAESVSQDGEQRGFGRTAFLGDEGLLEFTLPEDLDPEVDMLRLTLQPQAAEPTGTSSLALVELDIDAREADEILVIPFGADLIVGGVLHDESGNPIQATRLILRVHDRRVEPKKAGALVSYHHVRTDEAGRFQFRGPAPTDFLNYSLHRPSPGFNENWGAEAEVPFRFGQADLKVIAASTSDLYGRLLVEDPEILSRVEIRGVVRGEEGRRSYLPISLEVPNGRFERSGVSLATTELHLLERIGGRVLATTAVPFEEAANFVWDLRGSLFLHSLTLQASQREAEMGAVLTLPHGEVVSVSCRPGSAVEFLAHQKNLRFTVGVLGYRSQEVVSDGSSEVFLSDGIPVTLVLPDGVTFPEGMRWRLILKRYTMEDLHGTKRSRPGFEYEFSTNAVWQGGLELNLPQDGLWVAELTPVSVRHGMAFMNHARILATPDGMDVADQTVAQVFTLVIHDQVLDAIVQSVQQKDD